MLPRVSLTSNKDESTVPNPTNSLLVYNIDSTSTIVPGFYYWLDSCWVKLANREGVWLQDNHGIQYDQGKVRIGDDGFSARLGVKTIQDESAAIIEHYNDTSATLTLGLYSKHIGNTLQVIHQGSEGIAGAFGTWGDGRVADFSHYNDTTTSDGVTITYRGTKAALAAFHEGQHNTGHIAWFGDDNSNNMYSGVKIDSKAGGGSLQIENHGSGNGVNIYLSSDTSDATGLNIYHEGKGAGAWIEMADSNLSDALRIQAYHQGTAAHIRQMGTGAGMSINMDNNTSLNSGLDIANYGQGNGLGIFMGNESNGAQGLQISSRSQGRGVSIGMEGIGTGLYADIYNDTSTAPTLDLGNSGLGSGLLLNLPNSTSSSTAMDINHSGSGLGLYVNQSGPGDVVAGFEGGDVELQGGNFVTDGSFISNGDTLEHQVLSISDDTIFLSNGGFLKLPAGFDGQYGSLTGSPTNVSHFNNDAGYITSEIDGSTTNEIQTISRNGLNVNLSIGGGSFTDSVNIYTAGSGIDITNNVISTTVGGSSGLPTGTILPYAGGVVPSGYLLCNGSEVDRTTYASLYSVLGDAWGEGDGSTTFNLPDFRGRFLRGVDHGAGNDPDAGSRSSINSGGNSGDMVGSYQEDTFESHRHSATVRMPSSGDGPHFGWSSPQTPANRTTYTNFEGGSETRPLNAGVEFIIKY